MKTKRFAMHGAAMVAAAVLLSACSMTGKRAAMTAAGTAIGAGVGYAVAPESKEAAGAAIGAVAGGVATVLAQGRGKEYQQGVDDGYLLATSDDVKRLYWAKQSLESAKNRQGQGGVIRYYVFEDEGTTQDGRKLAPEKVAIPVYEPIRED